MKTAQLKSTILSIIILFLSAFSHAQPLSSYGNRMLGVELSKEILAFFKDKGFTIEQQDLLPSDSTSFPQNLIIYVSADESVNSNKKSNDSSTNTIIFDFTQEFAYSNIENLYSFIEKLRDSNLSYDAVILLAANDALPQLFGMESDGERHPSGTQTYTSRLGYDDRCAALVVSSGTGGFSMTPGAKKDIAPLWMVRTIYEKAADAGCEIDLTPWFPLLYSLGLAPESPRLSPFMDLGIPASGISVSNPSTDFDILLSIAREFSVLQKDNWDRNYMFLKFGGKTVWIPEAASITLLLLVLVAVLMLICFTGILPTPRSRALTNDIKRTWFLYPLTITLITLLLHLSQLIFSPLSQSNPLLLVSLKVFISSILIFLVFILQVSFDIRISLRACGFMMVASAILNVFVFSSQSLISMYMFALELIIIYVSEKAKTTPTLILTFLITPLPFLSMVGNITQNTLEDNVSRFVLFSWKQDALLAMILFPVMMQLERIFISTDLLSPNRKLRKRNYIITSVCAETVLIAAIWAIYGYTNIQINNSTKLRSSPAKTTVKDRNLPTVSADLSEQAFMELAMQTLTVSSSEDVIRYEITMESESGVPIFESNYEYILEAPNRINFTIPDFPSGDLEIIYSTAKSSRCTITISAYILDTENRNVIFRDSLVLTTQDAVKESKDGSNG